MHGTFTRLCRYRKSWRLHGAKILELPYVGDHCNAYFILPGKRHWFSCPLRKDRLRHVEKLLTPAVLLQEIEKMDFPHAVTVEIPKFSLKCTMAVEKILAQMGMPTAFSDDADLSGISTQSPLKISTIMQTAVYGIDESKKCLIILLPDIHSCALCPVLLLHCSGPPCWTTRLAHRLPKRQLHWSAYVKG
ncbi:alpha-1-antitrypsin-like protein GS55-LT [Paramacrobiotus metropolitanus]|uniref:alpha-1-antitrypsin-like protein GS55-LT n=1 Tax=Paramacrobiotus metropolitanus TaxID=2943436 RepID=UPI002445A987|nr:alpha-1-antitrypsin-like protein GS55-LT [Paramacrobiotus metropolitanus]